MTLASIYYVKIQCTNMNIVYQATSQYCKVHPVEKQAHRYFMIIWSVVHGRTCSNMYFTTFNIRKHAEKQWYFAGF